MGRYIDKFGLEIEGVWRDDKRIRGFNRQEDRSIKRRNTTGGYKIEYVTEPIKYTSKKLEWIWDKVHELYRDKQEINKTMGLHIHVSLVNDGYLPFLTTMKFYQHFLDRVNEHISEFKSPDKERLKKRKTRV